MTAYDYATLAMLATICIIMAFALCGHHTKTRSTVDQVAKKGKDKK